MEPVRGPAEYEHMVVWDMPSGERIQSKISKKNTPLKTMKFEQTAKEGVFLNLDDIKYNDYDASIEF